MDDLPAVFPVVGVWRHLAHCGDESILLSLERQVFVVLYELKDGALMHVIQAGEDERP